MTRCIAIVVAATLFTASHLLAQPLPGATEGVSLTVYNNDFAVVKDVRTLNLPDNLSTLQFTDVARQIDPTSVHFKSLTDPDGTTVLEQNYEFDLVSADKLLDKYIDRPIIVITGDGSRYDGTLLSFDGSQIVLQGADQLHMIQRADNVRHIEFSKLPEGLLTRPTLVWQITAQQTGEHLAQVTYQTAGMSWQADYNVVVNADDTAMDLSGWVTINNMSGAAYKDAKIKLIAGDVRRVMPPAQPYAMDRMLKSEAVAMAAEAGFEEKAFFEYHLYTLGRPSTVNDNQIKQIELLTAAAVPVVKRYVFEPGGRYWHRRYGDEEVYKLNVYIEFKNDEASRLGMPLPKGKLRVYKQDEADGELEFIGEDQIDHTPRDEQVKLYVGDAFDLVGEKTITDQKRGERWLQQTVEINLRNHKDEAAEVLVREHLNNTNWTISNNTHPFTKDDAMTVEFTIPVEASGSATLRYTVDYRW